MSNDKIKRGYLKSDFEYFHLKDQRSMEFEYHYHEFNKIIFFITGNVKYLIEGKVYKLRPWDILFVNSNDVHMPVIDTSVPYERIIIWVNNDFLENHSSPDCRLLQCFDLSSAHRMNLLRTNPSNITELRETLLLIEAEAAQPVYGSRIMKNSLFLRLIVLLNRHYLGSDNNMVKKDIKHDKTIDSIINHINDNLQEDLSIEKLASKFYMSKYNLMHKFKLQTGFTIHSYILQKRLYLANTLIRNGSQIFEACMECGFGDYTSFVKAFKKVFGVSPREYHKAPK
ncbi:MAG: AraC family transcriptional regulator [Bacillota bacterium]